MKVYRSDLYGNRAWATWILRLCIVLKRIEEHSYEQWNRLILKIRPCITTSVLTAYTSFFVSDVFSLCFIYKRNDITVIPKHILVESIYFESANTKLLKSNSFLSRRCLKQRSFSRFQTLCMPRCFEKRAILFKCTDTSTTNCTRK